VGTFESFDADAAARSGADGHLKKPFDSQELLRRVRELATAERVAAPVAGTAAAPEPLEIEEAMWEPLADEPAATAFAPAEPAPLASPEPRFAPFEPVRTPAPPDTVSTAASPLTTPVLAGPLSDADVDRIARRVIELLGDKPVRDVAWEVVPDLAEVLLKSRIRELEASVE
jgi:hypothetical protein